MLILSGHKNKWGHETKRKNGQKQQSSRRTMKWTPTIFSGFFTVSDALNINALSINKLLNANKHYPDPEHKHYNLKQNIRFTTTCFRDHHTVAVLYTGFYMLQYIFNVIQRKCLFYSSTMRITDHTDNSISSIISYGSKFLLTFS